ncbi:hypothetical protein A3A95_03695 [Candidatus Nomurabacteria bacterium RIFCSPLOWO2_01_FULL_39_18]|uniref:POTRA domain-containing protein n=1 Tax=Candidatus Nomurabacteria bacterium RIFCSPHIGHO2_01_FULL_40_24b TaxID=1801739 RepID=A0A1F6V6E5_9BACT|nr:MAG: hypothetical protein A2647_04825 [Candidatus Nomurabacteria bacterium RIFCSPHIGHO2_01_FULL_40_24b]OGI89211.1 MAG: hypothetical protein A3A95_03695 [Candidatus Nomurabacteria bacterium RIFCSPLOWO2_01_FULL_39_18]
MIQKRDLLNSPRLLELDKKRRKIFLKKFSILMLGLLVTLICLAYVSRIEKLNISGVEISGNKIIDTQAIKDAVDGKLAEKYLWFFPKTNIFFYPKNDIKNNLSGEFKRLEDIELSVKEDRVLHISLTERRALYTWCGEKIDLKEEPVFENGAPINKCYFLDKNGFIFDEAPYFSGEVYFKFYGKLQSDPPLGSFFSETNFGNLILFKETLEDMGLRPVAIYIIENETIKIYLSNESQLSMGPEIILKSNANFQKVAENLQAALATEPLQSDFKNKYSSLLYINLQFGNKVYYKFRQ